MPVFKQGKYIQPNNFQTLIKLQVYNTHSPEDLFACRLMSMSVTGGSSSGSHSFLSVNAEPFF